MATKAAKSITINATKYELANALGVANGKLQLKAKDVVLDEAEVGNAKAIFVYNHYDSGEGYYVTDAIKDIEGNVLTNADVCSRVKDGAQIYVQVVAASGSNTGKFQLLDKYEHEVHGGGAVVDEHFWSEGNAFNKYISMTFRLADNWVSAPNITDKESTSWITLTFEYDFDTSKYLITALDCSDDIEPTTYTAMDLYNDWSKGDLKIVLNKSGKCYLVNRVQHEVDYEGVETHYINIQSGGAERNLNNNDKSVFIINTDVLVGTDTINTLTTTKKQVDVWGQVLS